MGDNLELSWSDVTTPFPSSSLQLRASDSVGAVTMRNVLVVLCECNNGGNCTMNMRTLDSAQYDSNGYYQWPCECPEFFGGSSCQVDERGCGEFDTCPTYSVCVDDDTVASGRVCQDCISGFQISDDGGKCVGKATVCQRELNCTVYS
jgi:hypothetical protein